MKAFWLSVVVAIGLAILAGVVLRVGVGLESAEVYQSQTGNVKL